jgi:hypothetical protein
MDTTVNRGYPFPQCEPPLIKDEANAPAQTRLLAEAMAADFDTVSALIDSAYQYPTAIMRLTNSTPVNSTGSIPFDTIEYDPEGWVTLPNIIVPDNGIYLITAFAASVSGTNVQSLALQFTGDGSGFYLQGTSPPASGFGRMTANGVTVRNAGSVMGAKVFYSGTASNFDNCWMSVTRLVKT